MKKQNRPLTEEEKNILSETTYDDLLLHFPNHTRRFLLNEKKNLPIKEQIEIDRKTLSEKSKFTTVNKKYAELIKEIERLEQENKAILRLKNEFSTFTIPEGKDGISEAVAFLVASDWHAEEEVKPDTVNGMNEFNLTIADYRIKNFAQNSLKLLKNLGRDVKIETVVLVLGGDFISGNIHEENLETSALQPIDASIWVQERIASVIKFLLDNSDYNLLIPCVAGNHSRITPKQRVSTEIGNALETFMYHSLALQFQDNPRVTFILQGGYFIFLNIYDKVIRIHHGHGLKYGGGVGGITIPVNKAVAQWNKMKHADLDIFGHWHQKLDNDNWLCNGSLIGWNPYAIKIHADFQEPKQTLFLLDKKRGKTIVAPIILNGD